MATLTIHCSHRTMQVTFDPPMPLHVLLEQSGVDYAQPCGGRGVCGKCAVLLEGACSEPTPAEERLGVRLGCQAVLTGDASVVLPQGGQMRVETGGQADMAAGEAMPGQVGAAVDIGTTTLALRLYDLSNGRCLSEATMLNPQTAVAADVIGRIEAALKGRIDALQAQVLRAVEALLVSASARAGLNPAQVESIVLTGNTTMLYLLTGRNPASLSHAPFLADHLFGEKITLLGRRAWLPLCLHAFVGADVACAVLASGMCTREETALLMDVGTNGEMALWHQGKLYIASTAAGPAFEGAGIRCGCGSIQGAIDQVTVVNGGLHVHTIGGGRAIGLCGSGLIDAAAALLDLEWMDETGFLEDDEVVLQGDVALYQEDIRAVQLAKAAMAAGASTLLDAAGCTEDDVSTLWLAGGFGSHLNLRSASRIGLIAPALAPRVQVIGNGALTGASMLLTDQRHNDALQSMARQAEHVRLDANPVFSERYIEAMMFEEND